MQVVSKVVSAGDSTVAIVDPKEGALRPVFDGAILWLDDIEYDGNAVFVIISD